MPRNVEIKARIGDLAALELRVAALAEQGPTPIAQDDTFFRCEGGRLKLRALSDTAGELIFYQRADERGPKESFYLIAATTTPDALRALLTHAHGAIGRVRKQRTLYLVGRTRVHLDAVEELGDFLELEVVLADGEAPASGITEAHRLLAQLGIAPDQLVATAYVDLLAAAT